MIMKGSFLSLCITGESAVELQPPSRAFNLKKEGKMSETYVLNGFDKTYLIATLFQYWSLAFWTLSRRRQFVAMPRRLYQQNNKQEISNYSIPFSTSPQCLTLVRIEAALSGRITMMMRYLITLWATSSGLAPHLFWPALMAPSKTSCRDWKNNLLTIHNRRNQKERILTRLTSWPLPSLTTSGSSTTVNKKRINTKKGHDARVIITDS